MPAAPGETAVAARPGSAGGMLGGRGFGALLATRFLLALAATLGPTALLTLAAPPLGDLLTGGGARLAALLVALAPALLVLPAAGRLADREDKAVLIRRIAAGGVLVLPLPALGILTGDPVIGAAALALQGLQAAAFGPVARAIVPALLPRPALAPATALLQAAAVAGMMVGLVGGFVGIQEDARPLVAGAVALALGAAVPASRGIPAVPASAPGLTLARNPLGDGWCLLLATLRDRALAVPLLGFAWLWLVLSLTYSRVPTLGWLVTGTAAGASLAALLFALGFAGGALLGARLMRGGEALVGGRWAPLAIALLATELWLAVRELGPGTVDWPWGVWLDSVPRRLLLDVTLLAAALGLFAVAPSVALLVRAPVAQGGRVQAASALLAVLAAGVGGGLAVAGLDAAGEARADPFLWLGLLSLPVALVWLRAARA